MQKISYPGGAPDPNHYFLWPDSAGIALNYTSGGGHKQFYPQISNVRANNIFQLTGKRQQVQTDDTNDRDENR